VWSETRAQLELIDALPAGTGFLGEIDAGQVWWKGEWQKEAWDYSLDHDRVADRAVAQGLRCSRREREFWLKTETAYGVELLQLPYVPALGRSAGKWQSVRSTRPHGVIQRWGFVGMFDSAAERLAWLARWDPSFAPDEAVDRVARQLVGPDAADGVVRAWRAFDEAVGRIPTLTLCHYYVGPTFLGPAHPLPLWEGDTPDVFRATLFYLAEERESFDLGRLDARDDIVMRRVDQAVDLPRGCEPEEAWSILEREFAAARDAARDGLALLMAVDVGDLVAGERAELDEQRALGEHLYRSFRTTLNVLRSIRLRDDGQAAALAAVVGDEEENTVGALALLERAPWLDLRLRSDMEIAASADMLQAKLELLRTHASAAHEGLATP
jgi:hypothetical protein